MTTRKTNCCYLSDQKLRKGVAYHNIRLGVAILNAKKKTYDYGECEVCDTLMLEQRIKQDFWIRGELIVIDNVVAGVCPQCGAKVVRADVGRKMAELLGNPERIAIAPRISVPVVRFDERKSGEKVLH